jgi:hypothetical protein
LHQLSKYEKIVPNVWLATAAFHISTTCRKEYLMNTKKFFGYGALNLFCAIAVLISLTFTACDNGSNDSGSNNPGSGSGDPALSGTITITPPGPVAVDTLLTAIYTGPEDLPDAALRYQWNRNGTPISEATSRVYRPTTTGSYTITVSAEGYQSKTSAAVIVTDGSGDPALSGTITITPPGPVTVNTGLTAMYTGPEALPDAALRYQWNRNGTPIPLATSRIYTPITTGSYTVTVSAEGYQSKTSAAVTVTGGSGGTPMPGSGSTLAERLEWVQNDDNVQNGQTYTFEVSEDEAIYPQTLSYDNRSNITIVLIGIGEERVISLSGSGRLFTVSSGVKLVLDNNITLQGHNSNDSYLVSVRPGGTLEMEAGSKITGNNNNNFGVGGVAVFGTFIMNGGEISGNEGIVAGGVDISLNGTFTMNGGIISGNTATEEYFGGGGVYVDYGTFTMYGGEISGNIARREYHGVSVDSRGTFRIVRGTVSSGFWSALYVSSGGTAQYGTFSGAEWNGTNIITYGNSTSGFKVENGVIQHI